MKRSVNKRSAGAKKLPLPIYIFAVLVVLALLLVLAFYIRRSDRTDSADRVDSADKADRTGSADKADGADSVFEDSDILPENSVVQVKAGSVTGSGVLFGLTQDGGQLIVVTAAHVLDELSEGEFPSVVFSDGTESACTSFLQGQAVDAALLYLADAEVIGSLSEEDFARGDTQHFGSLQDGDACIAIGGGSGETKASVSGSILDNWIYMEDYGQYMIWADVQIHAGMSGGGLFDSEGYLVGILSGGSDDGQTAAVPYSLILSEFHNSLD